MGQQGRAPSSVAEVAACSMCAPPQAGLLSSPVAMGFMGLPRPGSVTVLSTALLPQLQPVLNWHTKGPRESSGHGCPMARVTGAGELLRALVRTRCQLGAGGTVLPP